LSSISFIPCSSSDHHLNMAITVSFCHGVAWPNLSVTLSAGEAYSGSRCRRGRCQRGSCRARRAGESPRATGAGQLRLLAEVDTTGLRCSRPLPVRARIGSRSNSASPPRKVSINRPCAVVVSAHASPSERKPAFFAVIAPRVFNKSGVERASRSSRVTVNTRYP